MPTPEEQARVHAAFANLMLKYEAKINELLGDDAGFQPERIEQTREQIRSAWLAFRDTVTARRLE